MIKSEGMPNSGASLAGLYCLFDLGTPQILKAFIYVVFEDFLKFFSKIS